MNQLEVLRVLPAVTLKYQLDLNQVLLEMLIVTQCYSAGYSMLLIVTQCYSMLHKLTLIVTQLVVIRVLLEAILIDRLNFKSLNFKIQVQAVIQYLV